MFLEPELLHALVLSGQTAVLEQASLLERLAVRCDQSGAMNWLSHFLNVPSFKGKKPYLVLILRSEVTASSLQLQDVHAAVLLFEYRVLGLPTGAFSTDDWGAFRAVVAPEAERGAVAAMAAEALLKHGARLIMISCRHAAQETSKLAPVWCQPVRQAWRTRPGPMALPLEATLEATLAKLGKKTRFNLGYYRRRAAAEVSYEFVADARQLLQEYDLKALNARSINPIPWRDCRMQFRSSCHLEGGFLLGLRDKEERWLSLIGGWRQGNVTVLHWQMNIAGYEKLSIGTVMRSHFLQHEVEQGAKTLVFYGGTAHSMGNSFANEKVTDLIVQRRSFGAAALQGLVRLVASPRSGIRVNSILGRAIACGDLHWYTTDEVREAGLQGRDETLRQFE